jgi:hypothetical protein
MSALSIQPTYPIFTDIDGQPLEAGYVWLGQANLDPQVNPINVYWDAALTIAAPQPIRTLGGYPSRNGTPARLYVNSDYSIRVQNRNGSTVYSAPTATERYNDVVISSINANNVVYDPPFSNAVTTNAEDQFAQYVSVKDFGAVGDGVADDTATIQTAIDYCIANLRNLYFPAGTYLISSTLNFIDNNYAPDYPFPRLNQLILSGESGSKIKAMPAFTGTMILMGDAANGIQYKGALFLDGLTIDGGNQEITLVAGVAGLGFQARFYANKCNFLGVTGANSIALDGLYSSLWIKDCIIQGSGAHTTNGIGVRAKYTMCELDDCFVSYFGKAIYLTNFAETSVRVKNSLFQINAVSIAFEGGGYLNNACSFIGSHFVESKPGDVHLQVDDPVAFGSWGSVSFISCQFDGYNANGGVPLLDLDFGNSAGVFYFEGCNAWTALAPPGTFALKNIEIGQYTKATFESCTNFDVVENNNPQYAKFGDWKATGTDGGTSSSGFNTRTLNTTIENGILSCTLVANVISLPKGVYKVQASAPCIKGNRHRLTLYNDTKSAATMYGTNNYAAATDDVGTTATLSGRFVLNESCQLRLLHYIENAVASIGLGAAVFDGQPEIYAQIEIFKEA